MSLNLSLYTGKVDGQSTLTATEWNSCMTAIQNAVNSMESGTGGSSEGSGSPYIQTNDKGNLEITAPASTVNGTTGKRKGGKINIESNNDIQLKPSDDIVLYSHHRSDPTGNSEKTAELQKEVNVKVTNGDDIPVKLQLNVANLTLTTKDKNLQTIGAGSSSESEILDVNVNTGKGQGENKKAYLKVRARAIDLRCEEHGGIALLPKGTDGQNHENKIKFEHGGGDGLEFGTFNTLKTSLFTDEYRFNKDGIWKQAKRTKTVGDKYDNIDETTQYKYLKNPADDFYDFFDSDDVVCDTKSIIKTANALNYGKSRSCKMDGEVKGDAGFVESNLELKTKTTYKWYKIPTDKGFTPSSTLTSAAIALSGVPNLLTVYDIKDTEISTLTNGEYVLKYIPSSLKLNKITIADQLWADAQLYSWDNTYYVLNQITSPGIKIESEGNIKLTSNKKISIESSTLETFSNEGKVNITAGDNIALDKSTSGAGIVVESPIIKFDGPTVQRFNSLNVSATGKLLDGGYIEAAGEFNLQHAAVKYDKTAGKVYVLIEPVYTAADTQLTSFDPGTYNPSDKTKTPVWWDSAATSSPCRFVGSNGVDAESGAKIYLPGTGEYSDKLWVCDTTKNGEMKAKSKAFDSTTHELSTGDAEHLICATLISSDNSILVYQGLSGTEFLNTYYVTDLSVVESLTTGHDVVTIQPKREWQATTKQVSYSDVVNFISEIKEENISFSDVATLVNWMKTNNQGPWATL